MSTDNFLFKKFSVSHSRSTMKVGTDSVLLGSIVGQSFLCEQYNINHILDIGTGCGVLSLIMAQYFSNAIIDAIDIDEMSVDEAKNNFLNSPWHNRLTVENIALQQFTKHNKYYDLIISNPPYFENSLKSLSVTRSNARHTDTLPLEELASCVIDLLTEEGVFSCIFPEQTGERFKLIASVKGLYCIKENKIFSSPLTDSPIRIIYCLSKKYAIKHSYIHYLYDSDGMYSGWYHEVTKGLVKGKE